MAYCIRSAEEITWGPMLRTSSTVPASTLDTRGKAFSGEYSMATRLTPDSSSPSAASMESRLLYTVKATPDSANLPASTWWTSRLGFP